MKFFYILISYVFAGKINTKFHSDSLPLLKDNLKTSLLTAAANADINDAAENESFISNVLQMIFFKSKKDFKPGL